MEEKHLLKNWLGAILLLAVTLMALVWSYPYARDFMLYPETRQQLADAIDALGAWGPLLVFVVQVAQIILAFLPGEPVEVLAGMICGAWGGLLLCLAGILIGASLVLFLVRRFGRPLVRVFFSEAQLERYRFLRDERRLEWVIFLLFLIPGTPKDILTYAAGLTRINPVRFLLISTLARIPSVVTSTMAGDALSEGNFVLTAGFFALATLLAGIGLRVHRKWVGHMGQNSEAEEAKTQASAQESDETATG
jgi:uncharacterized membrane protein YdjX (TVP38/TMEM64 family)